MKLEGPWKRKNLADYGIVTQCLAPGRVNDQYLTNLLLKINAKVRLLWESGSVLPSWHLPFFHHSLAQSITSHNFCWQLGGLNSMLAVEISTSIPLVSKVPTIILGMDVSHGSPGQSDIPSIAAVCSSLTLITFYSQLLKRISFCIIAWSGCKFKAMAFNFSL